MPERVFGPASSHGVTVNAGSIIKARIRQESGVTQTLKHLRFGVAQLEPQGQGIVPLPEAEPIEGVSPGFPGGGTYTLGENVLFGLALTPGLQGTLTTPSGATLSSFAEFVDVRGVAFHPDATLIGVATEDASTTSVLDGEDGTIRTEFDFNLTGLGRGIAFSPDGSMVAASSGDNDPRFRILSTADGSVLHSGPAGITNTVGTVAFSPNGERLLMALSGSTGNPGVAVYDLAAEATVGAFTNIVPGKLAASWSPDGSLIAAVGNQGDRVHLIDATDGTVLDSALTETRSKLSFAPDGESVLVSADSARPQQFDVTARTLNSIKLFPSGYEGSVAFSPDGRYATMLDGDGEIVAWDFTDEVFVTTYASPSSRPMSSAWQNDPGIIRA